MGIRSSIRLWASFVALAAVSLPVEAAPQAGDKSAAAQQRKGSGLPIPRFASLRSDEVNVRTGPGPRYPIEWVFKRKAMPVEIVAEFENWRKIRDWQGASGWVHQSLLSGKRSFIIAVRVAANERHLSQHIFLRADEPLAEDPARELRDQRERNHHRERDSHQCYHHRYHGNLLQVNRASSSVNALRVPLFATLETRLVRGC